MKKGKGLYLKALILLLDEVLIAGLIILVLWKLGVRLPLWALLLAGAFCVGLYWLAFRLLSTQTEKALPGEGMLGLTGKAVTGLNPEGVIRVRGELWRAVSQGGGLGAGEEVTVVGIQGLKLLVVPHNPQGAPS